MSRLTFLDRASRKEAYETLTGYNFYFPYGEECSLKDVDNPEYMVELLAFSGFDTSKVMVEK